MTDFVSRYLRYVDLDQSEAPANYHRWTCLAMLGALLGRSVYLPFGHSKIYPNQYIMLMGSPGTRKGTALGIGRALATAAGFTRFAADKTSKERFLMDMKQHEIEDAMTIEELEDLVFDQPAETWVLSGEFTDFIGQGNMEFITMLTNLWDNLKEYENPKIHGKSVKVSMPTVNILGGNTPQGFALAFPPEALGNGFLSRVLFIHGEPTGKQITWPEPADELQMQELATHLRNMRSNLKGEMFIDKEARKVGEAIYKSFIPVDDARFSHYSTRRFTHLLKLAMLLAAGDLSNHITAVHLIRANTALACAEMRMPKALGEFGKNRNSDVANTIIEFISKRSKPASVNEIFKAVSTDVKGITDLADIMSNLQRAEKVQVVTIAGKQGYLVRHEMHKSWDDKLLDKAWLTEEERVLLA